MQNFLPGVGSTLLPEDPEALRLMRQRQMAEMLMAQGAQPIETSNRQAGRFVTPVSPLEGLAKLLQTGIGAYQQRKVDDRIQELGTGRRTALARLLRGEPAVGSVPAEEFEVDAEVNRTPPPFQGGNNTPVFARDPARQNVLDVGAPTVNVYGKPQPQAAPQPDDPITAYKRQLADQLESGAMTPAQVTQMMLGLQQLQIQRELDKDKPLILPEGGTAVDRRGEVIARGAPKDRTFTAGGVVYDKQTNQPIAGRFTQRQGDEEVTFEIRNGQPVEVARGSAFNPNPLVTFGAEPTAVADPSSPTGVRFVRKDQAVGKAAPASAKPAEYERAAKGYFDRMQAAEAIMAEVGPKGVPTEVTEAVGALPLIGDYARRKTMSVEQQRFRQAQEDWVRAKLRKESGAVIGAKEMVDEIRTYFPMPGDSPEVIAQKAQARQIAIGGMRDMAGATVPPSPSPAPAAGGDKPLTPEERAELQRRIEQLKRGQK
jgi:hypothetical protein